VKLEVGDGMNPEPLTKNDIVVLLEGCFVRYNAVKSAVNWLLKEIEKYVEEIQKHRLTTASEWKMADIMKKDIENLIKKAFEGVVRE